MQHHFFSKFIDSLIAALSRKVLAGSKLAC